MLSPVAQARMKGLPILAWYPRPPFFGRGEYLAHNRTAQCLVLPLTASM